MSLLKPTLLAEHGSWIRAVVCSDDCEPCAPFRERRRAMARVSLERARRASAEGKANRKAQKGDAS